MSLRVGYLRIAQETNSLSPVLSTRQDFERTHWHAGDELAAVCEPRGTEAEGFMRNAELSGFVKGMREVAGERIELVPLFSAWAVPGGPLTDDTHDLFKQLIADTLNAAGPLDGLYFCMHGAMSTQSVLEPEGDYLAVCREVLGQQIPIAASMDLHAQLCNTKVDPLDILCAYRTNPHRDQARVGLRVGRILAGTVLGDLRPTLTWRSLPLVFGGGYNLDFLKPMRAIYKLMNRLEKHPKVLYCSLFSVHLWHDSPDLGWACSVVTDDDPELAERVADELADALWAMRNHPLPYIPSGVEALEQVRQATFARALGTVCVCDASDIVGAGAIGENTKLLRLILEHGADLRAFVPLRDKEVVDQLWHLDDGHEVDVRVGAKLDPRRDEPLALRAVVGQRAQHHAFGRMVVLNVGQACVVLTENAPLVMRPDFYRFVGLEPWSADMVVVKSMFPFRLYFLRENRKTIYARTGGITDFDCVKQMQFNDPVAPLHELQDWRPVDKKRRASGRSRRNGTAKPIS